MFSENTLNEISARINIVDLISEYVQLKKSGQSYSGLCPFHSEKTASFYVHPVKQVFKCFGCQKGGSIFSFYSAIEGLSFPDTVRELAKRAGVKVEESPLARVSVPKPVDAAQDRLFAANAWAAKYFHYLLTEVAEHRYAHDYISGRGISEKTLKAFHVGVAPKGWNTLLTKMQKRGFTFAELVQVGLVVPKERSPTQGYDRFRERLMFPIHDRNGNVLGFGARLLRDEPNQPKYINTPESPLFSKRNILYALHLNQRGIRIRNEALIVEGYMDVLGLFECGVSNAVATMGTALTEEHCALIKPLTRNVVTIFDSDKAGTEAWRRSVHLLMTAGLFAKDLSLPKDCDPDEFVLKHGAETFFQLCEKAPRQVTKLLKEIASLGPLSEEQSAKVLSQLTPLLVASRNLPDRALLWDDISLILKVSREALADISHQASLHSHTSIKPQPSLAKRPAHALTSAKPNPVDLEFLSVSLCWPEHFWRVPKETWKSGIKEAEVLAWLDKLSEAKGSEGVEGLLASMVHQESKPWLMELAAEFMVREGPREFDEKLFKSLCERLDKRRKEIEIQALTTQVRLSQRLGDEAEQMRLLEKLKELRSQ